MILLMHEDFFMQRNFYANLKLTAGSNDAPDRGTPGIISVI